MLIRKLNACRCKEDQREFELLIAIDMYTCCKAQSRLQGGSAAPPDFSPKPTNSEQRTANNQHLDHLHGSGRSKQAVNIGSLVACFSQHSQPLSFRARRSAEAIMQPCAASRSRISIKLQHTRACRSSRVRMRSHSFESRFHGYTILAMGSLNHYAQTCAAMRRMVSRPMTEEQP